MENAYNAIRMKVTENFCPKKHICDLNSDVLIENNQFFNIADNVIEPEKYAGEWTIRYNTMDGVYAPFSFDGVKSENVTIEYNHVRAIELPRTQVPTEELSGSRHQGSRLFKFATGQNDSTYHSNFRVYGNRFDTRLSNAKRMQNFIDVPVLPSGMAIEGNRFSKKTPFNQVSSKFPDFIAETNQFDI